MENPITMRRPLSRSFSSGFSDPSTPSPRIKTSDNKYVDFVLIFPNSDNFKKAVGILCDKEVNPSQELIVAYRDKCFFLACQVTTGGLMLGFDEGVIEDGSFEREVVKKFSCEGFVDIFNREDSDLIEISVPKNATVINVNSARFQREFSARHFFTAALEEVDEEAMCFPKPDMEEKATGQINLQEMINVASKVLLGDSINEIVEFILPIPLRDAIKVENAARITVGRKGILSRIPHEYHCTFKFPYWTSLKVAASEICSDDYCKIGLYGENYVYFSFETDEFSLSFIVVAAEVNCFR